MTFIEYDKNTNYMKNPIQSKLIFWFFYFSVGAFISPSLETPTLVAANIHLKSVLLEFD